jgi:hypothetical protein
MDALLRHIKIESPGYLCCGLKPSVIKKNNSTALSNWIHPGFKIGSLESILNGKVDGSGITRPLAPPNGTSLLTDSERNSGFEGNVEIFHALELFDGLPEFYKMPKQPSFDDNLVDILLSSSNSE